TANQDMAVRLKEERMNEPRCIAQLLRNESPRAIDFTITHGKGRKGIIIRTKKQSPLKKALVDSIGQRNSYVKTWGCGGFLNETNIYSRGKSLCF
ncbi:hypothetical protein, partial [Escherichia coli]